MRSERYKLIANISTAFSCLLLTAVFTIFGYAFTHKEELGDSEIIQIYAGMGFLSFIFIVLIKVINKNVKMVG